MITTIKNRFDDFREDARKKLLDRKEQCEKELYALRSIKRVKKKAKVEMKTRKNKVKEVLIIKMEKVKWIKMK